MDARVLNDGSRHAVFKRWFEPEQLAHELGGAIVHAGTGSWRSWRETVIGGTVFLGRAMVEAALDRGDEVTYFHRGRHGRGLHPDAEEVLGDRATDLDRLPGGAWDTVIDTCGFDPETVGGAARAGRSRRPLRVRLVRVGLPRLAGRAGRRGQRRLRGRRAGVRPAEGGGRAGGRGRDAAARAARARGVIVGPHENIGRLPYWLRRMARGGDVLAPEPRGAPVQLIDARDLARWVLAMAADCRAGVFNAVAPPGLLTWEELLELSRARSSTRTRACAGSTASAWRRRSLTRGRAAAVAGSRPDAARGLRRRREPRAGGRADQSGRRRRPSAGRGPGCATAAEREWRERARPGAREQRCSRRCWTRVS